MNRIDLLRGLVSVENFDMKAIMETWLDMTDKVFYSEIEIKGYKFFHTDRIGRRGGGIALYVRDTLQFYVNTG